MKSTLRQFVIPILIVITAVLFTPSSWAARIAKVKGKKVLIRLEGEPVKKGQIFYVVNSKGRKKGLIKIKAIKGDRALAYLGKGRARKGYTLLPRGKKGQKQSQIAGKSKRSSAANGSFRMAWGTLLGLSRNSISIDLQPTVTEKIDIAGIGLNYKAMFDTALFEKFWFRGLIGVDSFKNEGKKTSPYCDSKVCTVNIQYATTDFWVRYLFSLSRFRPWLGAGFALWFPLSHETTILEKESITNTSKIGAAGGVDYFINDRFYIPLQVEYGFLSSSKEVKASSINTHLGFGMNF